MRSEQEIRDELSKFAKACDDNGTLIPIAAREAMRSISHTLAWVLDQSVTIPPYNVHCGCCCFSETVKHTGSERDCALGPYMCLAVGGKPNRDPLTGKPCYEPIDGPTGSLTITWGGKEKEPRRS